MLSYVLSYKVWFTIAVIIVIMCFISVYSTKFTRSPEYLNKSISKLNDNYKDLSNFYNNFISRYENEVEICSTSTCSKIEKFALSIKNQFNVKYVQNELNKNGFFNVLNTYEKQMLEILEYESKNFNGISKKRVKQLKKNFRIIKLYFDSQKNNLKNLENRNTTSIKDVDQDLNVFTSSSLKLMANLLISILNILRAVEDFTYEHERELIIESGKVSYVNNRNAAILDSKLTQD